MNQAIQQLHSYPFEKLNELILGLQPPAGKSALNLSIGEPKHAANPETVGTRCSLGNDDGTPSQRRFVRRIALH